MRFFLWMKEHRATGHTCIPGINNVADQLWSCYLEASGQSDSFLCWRVNQVEPVLGFDFTVCLMGERNG